MLSIIIPAYNCEQTLKICLQSIKDSCVQDYEIIVVDDCSTDSSLSIAKQYADKVLQTKNNCGAGYARDLGIEVAKNHILVFIDSDVVIAKDTLEIITNYFENHPQVDAITGRLSKEHPYSNFFSQYKNLYMNYIFGLLPQDVTFLYGSIHAIRKSSWELSYESKNRAQDTEIGQQMFRQGKTIHFIPSLEVVHYKHHSFISFVKNDFYIPFDWTKIFWENSGWKQIGKGKTGYAHSPKQQLFSIGITGLLCLLIAIHIFVYRLPSLIFITTIAMWLMLNLKFLFFLYRERGFLFCFCSIFVTLFDNFVMGCAIFLGLICNCSIKRRN